MRPEESSAVSEDRWREFWSRTERPAWPEYTQIRLDWLSEQVVEFIDSRQDARVVACEVGAGSGWVAMVLAPLVEPGRYVCSDVSNAALARLKSLSLRNVTVASPEELSAWIGRTDIVVCGDVLEHVVDRARFAASLRSLLGDGGRLLLTTPNRYYPIMLLRRCLGLEATGQPFDRPLSRSGLVAVIRAAGFRVDSVELRDTDSPPQIRARTRLRDMLLQAGLAVVSVTLRCVGVDTRPAMLLSATAVPRSDGSRRSP